MSTLVNWFFVAVVALSGTRSPEASAAVEATIEYRRLVLDPTTEFERCAVAAAVGRPAESLDSILGRRAARALSAFPARCSGEQSAVRTGAVISAVTIADSTAEVLVVVHRGEWFHRETYNLRRRPHVNGWGVHDVRVWGAIRITPVRSRTTAEG